jgi:hypothetical protein
MTKLTKQTLIFNYINWALLCQVSYFGVRVHNVIFWKDEVGQRICDIFGYFFSWPFFLIFTYITHLKSCFVEGILRFQKWVDIVVLDFQVELWCIYFNCFVWQLFGSNSFGLFYNLVVTLPVCCGLLLSCLGQIWLFFVCQRDNSIRNLHKDLYNCQFIWGQLCKERQMKIAFQYEMIVKNMPWWIS